MTEQATLVDSNVLLDLFTRDAQWADWSGRHLAEAFDRGPVVVNQIVHAEVSLRFTTIEELDAALSTRFVRGNLPWAASFLAARCFADYRRRGGTRTSTLPDFFVGAHAAVLGMRLLSRDTARYRTYFPTVELISPE
ncbi:type II toxin-antitoxin system VapC family toxin [Pseudonocardia broussonetiae]|uniref:Type II toxin-antitoxin system VapC family toxin n=1 Tax=Pseudonocardia broussonetiae TaxID=2736640 RepID=A0A6M6JFP6_9PSEU|nr:type II toxin-antitoxin system VapC family toxin [Pseudonocardia broussonetiae]QJY45923.1 type II toxin-antitoxin system VapC family toxin [Pseudonocardia broussonetiae]